ncbi:MAG: type II CAAX endopeptidase family protein [Rubripirellula sp.]
MDELETDDPESDDQSPEDFFFTAVLFESALGVIAIVLGWLLGPDARAAIPEIDLTWPIDWESLRPIGVGLGYGLIATIPMLLAIEALRRLPWEPVRKLERLSDDGVIQSLLQLRASEMIVISLCAGIGEELLFRGWLMPWLSQGWSAVQPAEVSAPIAMAVGLVGSSIAFGLVHPLTKLYIVVATVMGFYFGGLLIWSGNLLVPITAHAAYDTVQLIMTARSARKQQTA